METKKRQEEWQIINGYHVHKGGTWFEISNPRIEGVQHYGSCDETLTLMEIYRQFYPTPVNDDKVFKNVTFVTLHPVFFGYGTVHADSIVLSMCKFSECQMGYKLEYQIHNEEKERTMEWARRPNIIIVPYFVYLPQDMTPVGFNYDNIREIEAYLTLKGIPYFYL